MVVDPTDARYPQSLAACGSPPLTVLGQWPLGNGPATAVIASAQVPAALLLQTYALARQWRNEHLTVISGFQSAAEAEVWSVLWREVQRERGAVRLVKVLARGMMQRLPADQRRAMDAGRLTLLSPFPPKEKRSTRANALLRNEVAARLAGVALVPHAHCGSSTFDLARKLLRSGVRVVTLPHASNADLLTAGAVPQR